MHCLTLFHFGRGKGGQSYQAIQGNMMNKMLVAVFENERDAFNGLSALKDLHKDGDITVFADVVLFKDSEGKVSAKDSSGNSVTGTRY